MKNTDKSKAAVKAASATVRGRQYKRFVVVYRDQQTNERRRKTFNNKADADRWANQHNKDAQLQARRSEILHRKIGEKAQSLNSEVLRDAIDALEILNGCGTLTDAARSYMADQMRKAKKNPIVVEFISTYIEASKRENLRPATIRELGLRLNRFAKSFGNRRVDEITRADVYNWLDVMKKPDGQSMAANSKKHYRHAVGGMFNYAIEQDYIEDNPAAKKTKSRRGDYRRNVEYDCKIFTPDEAGRLMFAAVAEAPDMIAPLALGLFAGLRTAEIRNLEWARHIDLQRKVVQISGDIAKKRACRNVRIEPNLFEWLSVAPDHIGHVAPRSISTWKRRIKLLTGKAGLQVWPHNGMRHSFGSYHLEYFQEPQKTALQMGHTDGGGVLFEHYRQLTDAESAEKYWQIFSNK